MATRTGVKLTIYAYTNTKDGRKHEWGNVMADGKNIPYGDGLEGMAVIARELRKAHKRAAALRK